MYMIVLMIVFFFSVQIKPPKFGVKASPVFTSSIISTKLLKATDSSHLLICLGTV